MILEVIGGREVIISACTLFKSKMPLITTYMDDHEVRDSLRQLGRKTADMIPAMQC